VLRRGDGIFAYQARGRGSTNGADGESRKCFGEQTCSPRTARQILLHRLLGQREARWAHVPLVIGRKAESGFQSATNRSRSLRCAKRGVDPRQVVAHLARSRGSPRRDACEARELLGGFLFTEIAAARPTRIDALPY